MSKKIFKFGFIYALGNSLQKGIGFFVFMFLANQLTTSEYALFGLNYSLFTIIITFSTVGIYQTIVGLLNDFSLKEQRDELLKAGNSVYLLLSFITFLIVLLIIPFLGNQFNSFIQYVIFAFSASALAYFTYQSSLVRLNEEHWTSFFFSFVPYVLSYFVGFLLVACYSKEQSYYSWGFLSV